MRSINCSKYRHALVTPILAASLLGIGAVMALDQAVPVPAAAEPAPPAPQTVRGEVVMLSSNVCVVKDASGKSVMVKVRAQTRMEGTVREGAKVEVSLSPDGVATLIKAIK